MDHDAIFQIVSSTLLVLAGAVQMYMWKEIISLRSSRHLHAQTLQRHIGRFARIGEKLGIEWDDLEQGG